jgi:hypothetical protein
VALFSSFLIKGEGSVPIFGNSVASLVAETEVVDGPFTAFIRCLFEPLGSLVKVLDFVVVKSSKSVHSQHMTFSLGLIVFADSRG